ncbi:MAG: ribonuclease HII [Lactobacillus sp.]|jgi:ribonuclease HII|nr:ribonuclease HII [Lactobacillus sp.]MCH3906400.1 ribonuclease HII [Lactobacillus sp.]MCH3990025.1 ribonuclease HII [Lactobacillus sp.]MCH4069261.1 ribonuclease HII [Lactobacillus sp.]MCI1303563.1 ribonuclease HII [Lactobacillus sp.]
MTIQEIKTKLKDGTFTQEELAAWQADQRKGVQTALASWQKRQAKLEAAKDAFEQRFQLERAYWQQGLLVAGVDEVGRGPLAGPVVTAAVVLPQDFSLLAVNDSKKLTPKERLKLYPQILEQAVAVGIGVKSAQVIDQVNIYEADRLAMADAVRNLSVKPAMTLVDAMNIPLPIKQRSLIKGDAKSNSIAAASIVAKVFRDQLMDDYDAIYPAYGFKHNAGYGTAQHLAALRKYGPTPIHRRSFAPVSDFSLF